MNVTMTSTRYGSPDGFKVCLYHAGESYDIADNLAQCFIAKQFAISSDIIDTECTNPKWYEIYGNYSKEESERIATHAEIIAQNRLAAVTTVEKLLECLNEDAVTTILAKGTI